MTKGKRKSAERRHVKRGKGRAIGYFSNGRWARKVLKEKDDATEQRDGK